MIDRAPEILAKEFEAMYRLRREFRMRDAGAGKYDALCPAHDDRNKSLRVYRVDGRLYFKCYAGCSFNDVRQALGLPTYHGTSAHRDAGPAVFQPKTKSTRYNFPALADKFAADGKALRPLAKALGVSIAALLDADVGRCYAAPMYVTARREDVPVSAWTFPMCDAACNVIGLRMRAVKGGDKFSWTDSTPGLFVGRRWTGAGPILIVEGPTDRATAADWGFDTIGLPSCNDDGAFRMVAQFLAVNRRRERRDVVILANLDDAKPRDAKDPSKGVFYPGQDGARKLAGVIHREVRGDLKIILPPGVKDARKWRNELGGTRADVERMIKSQNPYRLRRTA